MSARDKANRVLIHVILILVSITMLVPFLWMILTAFKTMTEATSVNPFESSRLHGDGTALKKLLKIWISYICISIPCF